MLRSLSIDEWMNMTGMPVIDVRSPGEYGHAHMPEALSLPLFDDAERASIGTTYKQISKSAAMMQALDIVGPKMSAIVRQADLLSHNRQIKVHCWRGGMRSGSVAWLLHTIGYEKVYTLTGGYKAYRNWVLSRFEPDYPLLVLGGRTGSAKTEVLKVLASRNESIIDLEGLAHHKGSAFGWIGEDPQPSQEQFENNLAQELFLIKNASPVWLEDESERIGQVRIPHPLFDKLRSAQVFFLDIPKKVRVPHLVKTYSHFGDDKLEISILRISKRLGGLNTTLSLEALARKDYELIADLTLNYYDKYYEAGVGRRVPDTVVRIASDTVDPEINADLILSYKSKSLYGTHQTHAV
jgi:tRNA 2-selenouridine synthase